MRNPSGHQCKLKMRGSKTKSEQEHLRHFLRSIKRVTRKCLEISRCSRAKQRQRNVQKSVLHMQSCFFAINQRPVVVFSPFLFPLPLSITRFYTLFQQTINIEFRFQPWLNLYITDMHRLIRTTDISLCPESQTPIYRQSRFTDTLTREYVITRVSKRQ